MSYRVHHLPVKMRRDQARIEQFLNGLDGEVVAIVPDVAMGPFWIHRVDFLLVVERLPPPGQ